MILKYAPYYDIIQQVGDGSFGIVYEAVDSRINRRVAIKTIHSKFVTDPKIRLNCLKEANGYLKLRNHPKIVDLVDLVLGEDAIYIVMEFIKGMTLKEYIVLNNKSGKSISTEIIITIFNQVLSAIEHAHQKGIIHLDIKPENILLEGNLNVKVVDFGISKSLNELKDNQKVGTPIYMSPEQVDIGILDKTTDIYSIGLTMLTTVLGESIYRHITEEEVLFDQIKKIPIAAFLQKYPDIDPLLKEVILKATSKIKEERFASCKDFQLKLNNP